MTIIAASFDMWKSITEFDTMWCGKHLDAHVEKESDRGEDRSLYNLWLVTTPTGVRK